MIIELSKPSISRFLLILRTAIALTSILSKDVKVLKTPEPTVPSPINPPSGCYFHTRCECCNEKCKNEQPELQMGKDGRQLACWFVD